MKRQVIVVGAGPGGSTAAFYLAKLGIDVLLLDRETWPREKPCGGTYLPICYPMFEDMEILEEMRSVAELSSTKVRLSAQLLPNLSQKNWESHSGQEESPPCNNYFYVFKGLSHTIKAMASCHVHGT